jgi:Tat protein translocase TatB subunit
MFGIGLPELIAIFVLALIVVGPKRLPELARALGHGLRELQRAAQEIRDEFEVETRLSDRPVIPPGPTPPETRSDPSTRETS